MRRGWLVARSGKLILIPPPHTLLFASINMRNRATLEAMVASISAISQQVAVVKKDFQPLQQNLNDITTEIQALQSSHKEAQEGIVKVEDTIAPVQLLPSVEQDVKSLSFVMREVREMVMQLNERIGHIPDLSSKLVMTSPSEVHSHVSGATHISMVLRE
jgi:septal ring factor EnvC (AmiA/AmiB activator)